MTRLQTGSVLAALDNGNREGAIEKLKEISTYHPEALILKIE